MAISSWLLATSLGHCQTITNFILNDNQRYLETTTDTLLRLRKGDSTYSTVISNLRTMAGRAINIQVGPDTHAYRELVASSDYIYVPFANRADDAGNTDKPTMSTVEQGFFLTQQDLYVVAARFGNKYQSFGEADPDAFKTALGVAGVTDGVADANGKVQTITHDSAIVIDYNKLNTVDPFRGQKSDTIMNSLRIGPQCLNKYLEALLAYVDTGENRPDAQVGLVTAAVAISEAMRFPDVQERIQVGLSESFYSQKILAVDDEQGLRWVTLASFLPLNWDSVSSLVRGATVGATISTANVKNDDALLSDVGPTLSVYPLPAILKIE